MYHSHTSAIHSLAVTTGSAAKRSVKGLEVVAIGCSVRLYIRISESLYRRLYYAEPHAITMAVNIAGKTEVVD